MALAMLVSIGGFSGASYASEASKTQKVLLLDIGGLFLKFSGWEYGKRIGLCNIVAYAVRDIKNPAKMKQIIFGVLNQVDMEQDEDLKPTCTTSGDTLPYILCAYQAGRITDEEARELAFETFDKLKEEGHFVSDREADIVKSALTLMFTPEISAACNKELHDGTKLLEMMASQKDEQGKKKYLIIALSNWDRHSAAIVKEAYPHIFKHFDHVYFSGDIGTIKPNHEAYDHPVKKHDLIKDECVFLDDQEENITAAKEYGIKHAILYKNAQQAQKELQELGILPEGKVIELGMSTNKKVMLGAGGALLLCCLLYSYA